MRTGHLLLGILLAAACGRGDEAEFQTIPLQHLSTEEALGLVTPHLSEEIAISASRAGPSTLAIRGPELKVNQLADLIRRFDRPVPNVELRFQIIEADGFTGTDPAIGDVEAALRDVFRFRGYRLVGESLVQGQAPGRVVQQIDAAAGEPFRIQAVLERVLQSDSARAVSMQLELQGEGALLATSLTVPSGKTVVVGTARARRGGNTLILVVRPRIE